MKVNMPRETVWRFPAHWDPLQRDRWLYEELRIIQLNLAVLAMVFLVYVWLA